MSRTENSEIEATSSNMENTDTEENKILTEKEPKNRPPRVKLEGEELKAALQKQVEYYFSKENLQSDWYLLSQMDAEMFVPIKTIADFRMVKNLTTDIEMVTLVMRESKILALDETGTRVRPAARAFRNTLILRDIPSATDPEEIRSFFKDIRTPEGNNVEILELSSDTGDCWYITFENDDIALTVLESLRDLKFKDQPIQARIKTETVVRNYYVPGAQVDSNGNPYGYPYQQGVYMMPYPSGNYQYWDGRSYRGFDNQRGRGYGRGRRRGEYGGRGRGGNQGGRDPNKEAGSTRKRRGSQGNPNIQLGTADFPPLPSAAFEQSKTRYTDHFVKYSKQDITAIVSSMSKQEITKPEGIPHIQEKIILDQPSTELEVNKPYPKRVTAADIVQMAPPSPKSPPETPALEIKAPVSPKEKSSASPEKPQSEKTKPAKSDKSAHNGKSTKVGATKKDNTTNNETKTSQSELEIHSMNKY